MFRGEGLLQSPDLGSGDDVLARGGWPPRVPGPLERGHRDPPLAATDTADLPCVKLASSQCRRSVASDTLNAATASAGDSSSVPVSEPGMASCSDTLALPWALPALAMCSLPAVVG